MYNINRLKVILGNDLCSQLLFIHAITGCDTTSRIFGVGKKATFQKLVKGDSVLQSCSNEFISPNQTRAIIEDLGSKAMAVLFGGKCTESLASLRYNILVKKVSSAKSFVTPERLPPTASSTKFHCLRAYYQIMVWTEQEGDMDVTNWGWKLEENSLIPIMSEMNAAPDILLKMIIATAQLLAQHFVVAVDDMGYPVILSVYSANWMNVTIHITSVQRRKMTANN